jgi:hypothetical protein
MGLCKTETELTIRMHKNIHQVKISERESSLVGFLIKKQLLFIASFKDEVF